MKIDLSGKLAIVSGSTGGIGLGISQSLAEAGATVVVIGRETAKVEQALASIRQQVPGAQLRGLTADLGTAEGAEKLFAAEPRADILVNNLGIFDAVDFFDTPDSEWTRFYEVNVISGVRLSRHYAPAMVEQGWGRIIFLSSESGVATPADMLNYGVTKSANLAVSHGLAKRLAGTGVTVNAILPGPTLPVAWNTCSRTLRPNLVATCAMKPTLSSAGRGRRRSSSEWPTLPRWRIWSRTSLRRFPPPPRARPCAWMAV